MASGLVRVETHSRFEFGGIALRKMRTRHSKLEIITIVNRYFTIHSLLQSSVAGCGQEPHRPLRAALRSSTFRIPTSSLTKTVQTAFRRPRGQLGVPQYLEINPRSLACRICLRIKSICGSENSYCHSGPIALAMLLEA